MQKIRGEIHVNIDKRNMENFGKTVPALFLFCFVFPPSKIKTLDCKKRLQTVRKSTSFSRQRSHGAPCPPTTAPARTGHRGMPNPEGKDRAGTGRCSWDPPSASNPQTCHFSLKPDPQPFS